MLNTSTPADKPVVLAEHHDIDDLGDTVVGYGFREGHAIDDIDKQGVVLHVSYATSAELEEL